MFSISKGSQQPIPHMCKYAI